MKKLIMDLETWSNGCMDGPEFPLRGCPGIIKFNEILARYKAEPHIICLAAAKHYRLRPAMTAKAWIISLVRIGNRDDKFVAKGETFWEAEMKAREFLEGVKI